MLYFDKFIESSYYRNVGIKPFSKYNLFVLNDNSCWLSKVVNDLEGIVKLVRSLMCCLKFIKKTIFKVSGSL